MAMGIVAALIAVIGIESILNVVLDARSVSSAERTLHGQAAALAQQINSSGPNSLDATSTRASELLGDTRVTVRQDGLAVWWSRPEGTTYASASATAGPYEVELDSVDPVGSSDGWIIFIAIVAGLAAAAGIVWLVSGAFARRLRQALRALSQTAEKVAQGRLDVRAPVTDDEVGAVARVFNRMAARLQHEDARQREFLADVAHELRTPVTAIEGFAQALQDGTARTDEARDEAFSVIREEASRLREFVRELQELTWLDLDPPVNVRMTDLVELARSELSRQTISARGKGVELIAPEGEVRITTDPTHVRTIISNLVANAINATPEGGCVEVRVGASRGPFGADAFIAVIDTGVGIREEHIPLLFDRLFRVDTVRARGDGRGSGLGLSIVKRLATILDGRITVVSDLGHGSTFTLWLVDAQRQGPQPLATDSTSE